MIAARSVTESTNSIVGAECLATARHPSSDNLEGQHVDERILGTTRQALISEIFARYGSIDAFCAYLRSALDAPTLELPVVSPSTGGRHRRIEPRPTLTGP